MEEFPILKIVYCSTINDNKLRDEVLETFISLKGLLENLLTKKLKIIILIYLILMLTKRKKQLIGYVVTIENISIYLVQMIFLQENEFMI